MADNLWSVWLHNGDDPQGRPLPLTRIDKGMLRQGSDAFFFAFSHPEPAVLVISNPSNECVVVKISDSSRVIPPFDGKHSEIPGAYVHGDH